MSHDETHDAGHHDDHGSIGKYLLVFVCLCVLTGASFFTYSSYWPFHDTPQVGWAFMMAVSCTKALLVALFFMHLLWEANWKYVLTIPAMFMSLFLVLMLVPDVGMRMNNGFARYSEERLLHTASPPPIETSHEMDHGGESSDRSQHGAGTEGEHGS